MKHNIYLDNITTTKPSDKAVQRMLPFLTDMWGNPQAPHEVGQRLYPIIKESLQKVYRSVGAKEGDTFILTSSGAEAVNQVIFSCYHDFSRLTGRNHFVTASTDEAPAIMACSKLEQMGCVHKMVDPGKDGILTADHIAEAITPRTALVSLSWGNAVTGTVNNAAEIAAVCKERGIFFHLDITHVMGKLFFDWEDIGADFLTFNGDQIHSTKGTGGLFIKEGVKFEPFIVGGADQGGYRAGAYDVPGLVSLSTAVEEMEETRDLLCIETARLRELFEELLTEKCEGVEVFFRDEMRLPHISTVAFSGISGELLLYSLNRRGVYASMGGGSLQQVNLILQSCGVNEEKAQTALTFSLSRSTTEGEVEQAVQVIVEEVVKLRKLSQKIVEEVSSEC